MNETIPESVNRVRAVDEPRHFVQRLPGQQDVGLDAFSRGFLDGDEREPVPIGGPESRGATTEAAATTTAAM